PEAECSFRDSIFFFTERLKDLKLTNQDQKTYWVFS
ncbi:MAG: hypothetical protein ACJAVF_001413, partial [Paraglaciecola sp.]